MSALQADRLLDQPVAALGEMSTRLRNALRNEIGTVRELTEKTGMQLRRIPGFGVRSLEELEGVLSDHGLALKDVNKPANQPALPFPSVHMRINQLEQRIAAIERKLVHVTER